MVMRVNNVRASACALAKGARNQRHPRTDSGEHAQYFSPRRVAAIRMLMMGSGAVLKN
jgi:hypothetical protein